MCVIVVKTAAHLQSWRVHGAREGVTALLRRPPQLLTPSLDRVASLARRPGWHGHRPLLQLEAASLGALRTPHQPGLGHGALVHHLQGTNL